jgi:hypothetical protein
MAKCDEIDEAIADPSTAYAHQSERDHTPLKAVRAGKLRISVESP